MIKAYNRARITRCLGVVVAVVGLIASAITILDFTQREPANILAMRDETDNRQVQPVLATDPNRENIVKIEGQDSEVSDSKINQSRSGPISETNGRNSVILRGKIDGLTIDQSRKSGN